MQMKLELFTDKPLVRKHITPADLLSHSVTWTSNRGTRTGVITAYVPPHASASSLIPSGIGVGRRHFSVDKAFIRRYLVVVMKYGYAHYYCPRAHTIEGVFLNDPHFKCRPSQ